MTYTKQNWVDGEDGLTPLSADRLNYIEEGLRVTSIDASTAAALVPPPGNDLTAVVNNFVVSFNASMPYREPTSTEKANGVAGIQRLAINGADASGLLTPLGFTISSGVDSVTKRSYILATSEFGTDRGWGLYLVDLSSPIRMIIECPHPVSDQYSELMGLKHWQQVPGCLLMIAGAHRDAASGLADVAHQTGSLFHGVAASFADMKLPQIQYHGYADATAPGLTQVVSTGTGAVTSAAKRVSAELTSAGFTVGNAWDSSGSGTTLTATTNVQGLDAAAKNTVWIHVENNATTRGSVDTRNLAVQSVVAAEVEGLAFADNSTPLASAVSGQFPSTIGTANTAGTSAFASRSDHIHKERQATLDRITALESVTTVTGGEVQAASQQALTSSPPSNKINFGANAVVPAGITWSTNTGTVVTSAPYAFFANLRVQGTNIQGAISIGPPTYADATLILPGTPVNSLWGDFSVSGTVYLTAGTQFCVWWYNSTGASQTVNYTARPPMLKMWRVG